MRKKIRHLEFYGYLENNEYLSKVTQLDNELATNRENDKKEFASAEYSKEDKKIYFKNVKGEIVGAVDTTDFVKDGMIDSVEIVTVEDVKYLKIVFNTESGKEPILIPLTDIFNPNEYYTKEEVDGLIAEKESEITQIKKDYNTLKEIVAELGGNVEWAVPSDGTFDNMMKKSGTVKLGEDTTTSTYTGGITSSNKTILNLNGKTLTFTGATTNNPSIMTRGKQELTVMDKGVFDANGRIAIEANGADTVINLSGTTGFFGSEPTYVTDRSGGELIYCYLGTINISAGVFKNLGADKTFLLNCYDANYRNGTAKIVVTGGKFYDFNPGSNTAEGPNTSFLAEGYHTESSTVTEEGVEHTVYTVKKNS